LKPNPVALSSTYIYKVLVFLMTPFSWFANKAAYGFLRLFGVKPVTPDGGAMSAEELRTVVAEAGPMIPTRHRQMLLSILDLEHITVNDIMVPRQEIASINVEDSWEDILDQLRQTPHTRLPLHDGELDNLIGIIHMKRVAQELARDTLTRERLVELARAREPYFVPEGTPLNTQLNAFQRNRRRMAFVVDEYGDIQGFVTLEDILEEIVGEFTTDPATITHKHVHREAPGVFVINASATIRALNRSLGWQLPTDGPKTLNGLLVEKLETLPEAGDRVEIGEYQFEVLQIGENTVRTGRARRAAAAAA
jgi:Mg2+/Co2+ transporter CorB